VWQQGIDCDRTSSLRREYGVVSPSTLSVNGISVILRDALDALASVLFAAPCRICGQALTTASWIPICDGCLDAFNLIEEPMCACCGRPFASPVAGQVAVEVEAQVPGQGAQPLCRLCRLSFYAFDRARSFAAYDGALTEALLLLKYEEVTRLGHWFADRLAEMVARSAGDWNADIVVSVPLHQDRQRERGYNQAELIARPLAKRSGLKLQTRALVRIKPRPPQLVLSRSEHWKSVRGAYATRKRLQVDNLRVLLLDDVFTTGATLDACARALKRAGAAAVLGLTVGRVRSGYNTGTAQAGSVLGMRPGSDKSRKVRQSQPTG
jgi:competence protein ComFC